MGFGTTRVTSRQRAYDHLRESVLTDPSRAGTFLNEVEVATEIGVSRTPVREAFLLLAADGLVEMIPQRGAFVPPLTPRALAELFEVRALIESHAAEAVLTARSAPIAALRQELEQQRVLADAAEVDTRRFIEVDRDFHQILVDATDNALMSQLYATLRTRQVCAGIAAVVDNARREAVIEEHTAIVDALSRGDVDAAKAAVLSHLHETSAVLRAAL